MSVNFNSGAPSMPAQTLPAQRAERPVVIERTENIYENPISRKTERNLAVLSSTAVSSVAGAITYLITRTLTEGHKIPGLLGAAAAILTLGFTLPGNLYKAKVSAFTAEKEMDVFARDRSVKTNLTEALDKEVSNEDVSLDKKLDDNLKLQMANRGSAILVHSQNSAQQPAETRQNQQNTQNATDQK